MLVNQISSVNITEIQDGKTYFLPSVFTRVDSLVNGFSKIRFEKLSQMDARWDRS